MATPIRALALVVLVLTAVACSPAAVASLLPATDTPLVTVTTRGGECPEGACGSTIAIERDGWVHRPKPDGVGLAQLQPDVLHSLEAAIESTDFAAIRARSFTGECPVNVDGQEVIYEFGTRLGVERIASCETEIEPNHPLFVAVDRALIAARAT